MNQEEVVVVTGAGGIGQAIARRQGTGTTILFAALTFPRRQCAGSRSGESSASRERAVAALDEPSSPC